MSELKVCCFTGHRPDKLHGKQQEIEQYLAREIARAYDEGFRLFINGMCWGVDVYAGYECLKYRLTHLDLKILAAMPYRGFGMNREGGLGEASQYLLKESDYVRYVSEKYDGKATFMKRDMWMVDHSTRLIAYWDGSKGGTCNTVVYARSKGIEVVNFR